MRKAWVLLFTTSAMLGVLGTSAFTQEVRLKNDASHPLQIVSVSPQLTDDKTTFEGAKVTFQNTGKVPCVAFGASLVITFGNSQTRWVGLREDRVALGYTMSNSPSDQIGPGQTYTMGETARVRATTRERATITGIEVRLDYAEMADGSTYGDDPEKVGMNIHAQRFGHRAERKRLLEIYNTQGLQALLNELNRQ